MTRTLRPLAALSVITMVAAISGCGSSAPAETGASNTRADNTSHHTKAVKFSECMRNNGVGTFPDPNASGELTLDAVANGSSVNTSSPAFTNALRACKALEPAGFTGSKRTPEQQSAGLKFAQCIRENGVKDFPDPAPNEPLVDTNRIPSAAQPGGMSILNAAMHKCSDQAAAAGVKR